VKRHLSALLLSLGLSTGIGAPAAAYPVDCAILLCLAGGWPSSAECSHARAVFIQRITPWPIEPPLQIWNCPMRARFPAEKRKTERLFDISIRSELVPLVSIPEMPWALQLVQDRADVDISGPEFDFVRSVHVYQITYRERVSERGACIQRDNILVGSYDGQGAFSWARGGLEDVPPASDMKSGKGCGDYFYRSVLVDWQDHEGTYGYEEVQY
jgi:hypothetical protein